MAQVNICIDDELKAKADKTDPFFNPENMKIVRQSIKEAEEGKLTVHELIEE